MRVFSGILPSCIFFFPHLQRCISSQINFWEEGEWAKSSVNRELLQSFERASLNLVQELAMWVWAVGVRLCRRTVHCEERQAPPDEAA